MADIWGAWPSRLARLNGWRGAAVSIVTGAAIGLGHAPYSLIWLALPALCLAMYFGVVAASPRASGKRGWLIGTGYALVMAVWIIEPFLVDAQAHGWMAPFALILMASGIGLFWGAGFWVAARMALGNTSAAILALPIGLTLAGLARTYLFTGFPWGLLGYIWIDTPVYQFAAYIGPHGMTFATALVCTGCAAAIAARRHLALLGLVLALGGAVGIGAMLQAAPNSSDGPQPIVRLVQPNAAQHQKWDPELMPMFYERQLALSAAVSARAPDVVIWPESAVTFLLNEEGAPLNEMTEAAGSATVVFGARRLDGFAALNSLAVLHPEDGITAIYDKHHLVPFGEYLPGRTVAGRLGLRGLAAQFGLGFDAGPGVRLLDLGKAGLVLPMICYESIFPHELRRAGARPDWMLLATNDAWFGQRSGPYQHLAQARARAIEFGLPMVRAANTGISAVIDARGRTVDALPLGVAGRLDVSVPVARPATLYWRFGDGPTAALLAALMLWLAFRRRATI